jgi:hypothetical protein
MIDLPDPADFEDAGVAVATRSTPPLDPYTPEHMDASAHALGYQNAEHRAAVDPPHGKRKRRTRAQIEADEAAKRGEANTEKGVVEEQYDALHAQQVASAGAEEELPSFDGPAVIARDPEPQTSPLPEFGATPTDLVYGNSAVEDGTVELLGSLRHEVIENTKALNRLSNEILSLRTERALGKG